MDEIIGNSDSNVTADSSSAADSNMTGLTQPFSDLLTDEEQALERIVLEMQKSIPELYYAQLTSQGFDVEEYPQRLSTVKTEFLNAKKMISDVLKEDYAAIKDDLDNLLAMVSMSYDDAANFENYFNAIKEATANLSNLARTQQEHTEILAQTKQYLPEELQNRVVEMAGMLEQVVFEPNTEFWSEKSALATNDAVRCMIYFLDNGVSLKSDILKLVARIYNQYNDLHKQNAQNKKNTNGQTKNTPEEDEERSAEAVLDFIDVMSRIQNYALPHPEKAKYLQEIIRVLSDNDSSLYGAVKYGNKVSECIYQGFCEVSEETGQVISIEEAMKRAADYSTALKNIIKEMREEYTASIRNEEDLADLADIKYNEAIVKKLTKNTVFNDFYSAFCTAADAVKHSMHCTSQAEISEDDRDYCRKEFSKLFAKELGIGRIIDEPVSYIVERIGKEYIIDKFLTNDFIPRYNEQGSTQPEDWTPISIERAFNIHEAEGGEDNRINNGKNKENSNNINNSDSSNSSAYQNPKSKPVQQPQQQFQQQKKKGFFGITF